MSKRRIVPSVIKLEKRWDLKRAIRRKLIIKSHCLKVVVIKRATSKQLVEQKIGKKVLNNMMYTAVSANGSNEIELSINGVHTVSVEGNVYFLYGKSGEVLFSSPVDSVVCIFAK